MIETKLDFPWVKDTKHDIKAEVMRRVREDLTKGTSSSIKVHLVLILLTLCLLAMFFFHNEEHGFFIMREPLAITTLYCTLQIISRIRFQKALPSMSDEDLRKRVRKLFLREVTYEVLRERGLVIRTEGH